MDFITTLFQTLQEVVGSVGSLLSSVFDSVISLVYQDEGGLTVVGVLLLIGAAVGLFFFVFRWVRSLIKLKS